MKVYIANRSQEVVLIEILESATISDLKKEISANISDIKVIDQILSFKSTVLLDAVTIDESGITENSVIELLVMKRKTSDNYIHELEADLVTRIRDVFKKHMGYGFDVHTANQQKGTLEIRLQLWRDTSGRCTKIKLPENSKMSQLKDHIAICYEIPVEFQILHFRDQILKNDQKSLIDLELFDQAIIEVEKNDIEIFIETTIFTPNIFPLRVFPSEKIEQIKRKIERQIKCSSIDQILFWGNSVLEDCDVLRDKGITSDELLHVIVSPRILHLNVQIDDKQQKRIVCETTETIGQLKLKLERAADIPVAKQVLYLNNAKLENEKKFLIEYEINEASNVSLRIIDDIFTVVINQTTTNKTYEIDVYRRETIKDLKRKIMIFSGIPIDQQKLVSAGGKQLDEAHNIEYYYGNNGEPERKINLSRICG